MQEKDQPINGSQSKDASPKKTPSMVFNLIAIIAFVILIVAVNASAIYFGSKKNKASEPIENPVTAQEELEPTEETVPFEEEAGTEEAVIEETDTAEEAPAE